VHDLEKLSAIAVDCGLAIHRELGPGLLETVYETVLAAKLERRGLKVERQRPISIKYEDMEFPDAFRIDLLVDEQLVIEIKSVETLNKIHGKQLFTYLRLMQQPLGLLMNFGCSTFVEGLRRVVNNHKNFASSRLRVNQEFHETDQNSWHGFNKLLPVDDDFVENASNLDSIKGPH
jgi:GxxExxY protein